MVWDGMGLSDDDDDDIYDFGVFESCVLIHDLHAHTFILAHVLDELRYFSSPCCFLPFSAAVLEYSTRLSLFTSRFSFVMNLAFERCFRNVNISLS